MHGRGDGNPERGLGSLERGVGSREHGDRRGGPAQDGQAAAPARSARKRQAIIEAARTVFMREGYGGASMDQIAALAKVSKQTVYKNFADKERLFAEIIAGSITEAEERSEELVDALPDAEDLENDLRQFARQHVVVVMQPHLVQMRRIIIGEADRFPELARHWYARGPERAHATLARRFERLAARGLLVVPEPLLAAELFNWLILSIPMNRTMFRPDVQFSTDELERYADEAVRVFLAAYGA
ncbi:TetR/AcrR family transcriptional regulator [Phytoactinopolyspora alkaliphila]|uniref:TetR/AcrR family transcriptional regulator n=2 Tax=Phytoactinopolyspora alkaliphila TaxID=1783498 RepID=A0A6N9YSR5_9ACTN|nr:TetR/AcrR family transcriptional regulator [Phytoactinopolyspora alkaliphila]